MTQKTGKRYSEAQIIRVLEQVDIGQKDELGSILTPLYA
jgi:DNA topoisomerase IA